MGINKIQKYIYANQLEIGVGRHDIFIDLCNGYNNEEIIDGIRINMSIPFAKALCNTLNKSIKEYENKYGKVESIGWN